MQNHIIVHDNLKHYKRLVQSDILTREEEYRLAMQWKEEKDEKALHHLVESYFRLVLGQALRFKKYGFILGDLVQEGYLGLLIAAQRFEPARNLRFSTYARWWVRHVLQEFVLRNWSLVRIGSTVSQKKLFFQLNRLKAQLSHFSDDFLKEDEKNDIAKFLQVSMKDLEFVESRLSAHDFSLNAPVHAGWERDWMDQIQDDMPTPEESVIEQHDRKMLGKALKDAFKHLSSRERKILKARRMSTSPITFEALAKDLNVSKERVRQIEEAALRKMRKELGQAAWKDWGSG